MRMCLANGAYSERSDRVVRNVGVKQQLHFHSTDHSRNVGRMRI